MTPTAFDDLARVDPGIRDAVRILRGAGVETFESCQGGPGHAFSDPTVRFHGYRDEGFRALAVALQSGLRVVSLRRYWDVLDGEPTGPHWELVLAPSATPPAMTPTARPKRERTDG